VFFNSQTLRENRTPKAQSAQPQNPEANARDIVRNDSRGKIEHRQHRTNVRGKRRKGPAVIVPNMVRAIFRVHRVLAD
jgi:hypothetical protein